MKKMIFAAGFALVSMTVSAQTSADYLVKTKNAKKAAASLVVQDGQEGEKQEEEKAHDFISENFKFYSLCDWQEGMKFMVIPDKYDMIVKTFADANTGKEVSSMTLRHKIMIYQGHNESSDGHSRINFLCQDDNKPYYYEIPSGSFDDYCYGKLGVPTLAYLGDVDIARDKLVGRQMFTKATLYRIDTDYDSDGFQEVKVKENQLVTVKAVGVGTRSFPVKIIVEDKDGNEFYQNVAISRTNSGMRDDEFIMDNTKFAFEGSFELQDAMLETSKGYKDYIGKVVHTKYATEMKTNDDGRERAVSMPKMTSFTIDDIKPTGVRSYVTLTLTEPESRRVYYKEVTFVNVDDVTGDIDGKKEDYFGYLFAVGEGISSKTSQAVRTAIRQGRVLIGMTEQEVVLSIGDPDRTASSSNGRTDWIYTSSGKMQTVQFNSSGKVVGGSRVQRAASSGAKKGTTQRRTTSSSSSKGWQSRPGTPL